ncbi:protein LplB [Thermoclostridium stercorarium subsp. stercorarium DSM 8532]|jgi:putative aldouronate transport system permease protein|uniref:Protein LplB n=3 Tax=Thermoclostridium stercorarium TaxID=1510 RepID=L7VGY2_THES1|nr:ABC transporter permease subunit [Thermoclostridium stercorarium]AGC67235.1 protein LplB [Thermoclostridium stercorarium subsp. stercorarium DSM 8532]AGI38306.1 ABC transporter periplasmic subunit-1 [Thermoclostridium stercorarium subsp. stercorarium DSM 8532]ANW97743.1 sugar ABC transporter permease [Thermoclostridium stercorarium subsp. thermolacticum DSM 2910]ANX00270.1 sugar ABC transporter permease [Thermoclostridium stercorarium subsp. leptospartum DSM 9219]UZQ85816.1 ABC transporter 
MEMKKASFKYYQKPGLTKRIGKAVKSDWQLYVLLLPALAFIFVFCYLPLYGVQIAFRDYKAVLGITGSPWVGLKNFKDFFNAYYFRRLLENTFLLNLYGLLWGFPVPIVLAILLNQIEWPRFRKFTQTVIYIPHFISTVVMAGILYLFLSPDSGIINTFIKAMGGNPIHFMIEPGWFRTLFIVSDIWQHAGWNTILYIAALTGIDPELYEAATIDGATKHQKIRYIDIPHLAPIVVMMLILSCGNLLVSNTDKALLMQTPGNMVKSDIIGVYVYQMGLTKAQFSYTAAIGLFINVINFIMIITVNWISKKLGDTSLF